MGRVGRVRRVFVPGLALALVAPLLVPMGVASADHDGAHRLQQAIGEVLSGLAGVDTADAVLDPIPLTPARLDQALSLPAALVVLEHLVHEAGDTLADLQESFDEGISLEDFDTTALGLPPDLADDLDTFLETIQVLRLQTRQNGSAALEEGVAQLAITLERDVTSPLVALSDLVAYDPEALPLSARFDADLDLIFDPEADDLDLRIVLDGVTLGATVGARFGDAVDGPCDEGEEGELLPPLDPLRMNVGILAVEAAGQACASVALTASAGGTIPLDDWTGTPPRDLFAVGAADASVDVQLDLLSDLQGLAPLDGFSDAMGTITIDSWTADAAEELTAWQDEVEVELGDLEDFRNIFLEEVIAGIAQLAVSLGATQLSGVGDFRLPLLSERASDIGHLGQAVIDWLLDQTGELDGEPIALAKRTENGAIRMLEDLDREALVALKLTDLQTILQSLSTELAQDFGESFAGVVPVYDAARTELGFDLAWSRESDRRRAGEGEDAQGLRFNLSDRLQDATGLSGLVDTGASEISVDPSVQASLGVTIDLSVDEAREFLAEHDFDVSAFDDEDSVFDADDLLAVGERVKLVTEDDASSVGLDLPVEGTLDLAGAFGFLGLSATATSEGDGPPLRVEAAGDGPMLSVTFRDGAEPGRLSLDELLTGLTPPGDGDDEQPSIVDVDFGVQVPRFDLALTADVGAAALTGSVGVEVEWSDLTEGPNFTLDTSGLEELADFRFSADPFELLELVLASIDRLTAQVEDQLRAGTDLGSLPLVDVDIADLVHGLGEVRDRLGDLADDPAPTLQAAGEQLNCLLVESLTNQSCPGDVPDLLVLDVVEDEGDRILVTRLDFEEEGSIARPFELDVAALEISELSGVLDGVVGMSSQGQVEVDYGLTARLHAGVVLPDVSFVADPAAILEDDEPEERFAKVFAVSGVPELVLFDSSGIRGSVDVESTDAVLEVTLGPLSASAGRAGVPVDARTGVTLEFELDGASGDGASLGSPVALSTLEADSFRAQLGGTGVTCKAGFFDDIQPDAFIQGTVTDVDDAGPLAADITVSGQTQLTATSDASDQGIFEIEDVPPGTYTITVSKDGYETETEPGVELDHGETATVTVSLAPTVDPDDEDAEQLDGQISVAITPRDSQAPLEEPDRDTEGTTGTLDACARMPLYLNDTWVGDLLFTAPELANLGGWDLEYPDDLVDRLGDALLDWSLLFDGLRQVVRRIASSVDGAAQGVRLPVIGRALDGGANLAGQLETALDGLEDIAEFAGSDPAANLEDAIADALADAFGEDTFDVALQCAGGCGGKNVGSVTGAEVTLAFGDETNPRLPRFDLGFPGLRLNVDDEVHATAKWDLELTFGLERNGFYLRTAPDEGAVDPRVDEKGFLRQLELRTDVALPGAIDGDLALFRVALDRKPDAPEHDLTMTAGTSVRLGTDGKAPLHQLGGQLNRQTLVLGVDATADLQYGLTTQATLPGSGLDDELFPSLTGDFLLSWTFGSDSAEGFSLDDVGAPDAFGFRDVKIHMGGFLDTFLEPIVGEVRRFTAPFQPVIDTISTPIPGLSDLSVLLGLGEITMIDLFEQTRDNDLTFIKRIIGLVDIANQIGSDGVDKAVIDLGRFDIDVEEALAGSLPPSRRDALITDDLLVDAVKGEDGLLAVGGSSELPFGEAGTSHSVQRARVGGGFTFPAYETPSELFGLLVGKDVTLVRWDSGGLRAGFSTSYNFPPIFVGPVPIGFSLSAAAQIEGRFAIGYDTHGIRRAVEGYNQARAAATDPDDVDVDALLNNASLLVHGIFLDDLDAEGSQVPELVLSSEFAAGAGVSLGVISAGLELGLRALIDFDLRDPTGTGRIRIQHILANIRTPICLFEVGGQLDVFLRAFVKISLGIGSKTSRFTIFDLVVLRMDDILEEFCSDVDPDLAQIVEDGNDRVLVVNAGPRRGQRGIATSENTEEIVIRPLNIEDPGTPNARNTAFSVAAFGEYEEYGLEEGEEITGVSAFGRTVKVVVDGGDGHDQIKLLDGAEATRDDAAGGRIDGAENIAPDGIPMISDSVVCGGGGDDVIVGGRGDDILVGDGACTIDGALDITIALDEDPLTTDEPDEAELEQKDGDDRIHATAGNNLVFGLGGGDQLYGGTGDDVLVGGSGADLLRAGDPPQGSSSGDVLVGGMFVRGPSDAGSLPPGLVELPIPQVAAAPGDPGDDELFGGSGGDVLIGDHGGVDVAGHVWVDTDEGRAGDDFLDGGPGNDRLFGGPGDDELYGGRGDDALDGGPGEDVLVGGSGEEDGRPGRNVLVGGPGDDQLIAHDAVVERDGDGRAETLTPVDGDAVDDAILIGGALTDMDAPGDDELWGSGGNDILIGDNAEPTDEELAPSDHGDLTLFRAGLNAGAFGELGDREDDGYPENLVPLTDDGGDDRLHGGPGDDTLIGGPGHDVLVGGWPVRSTAAGISVARVEAGDDLLIGGDGDDLLVGDHAEVVPPGATDAVGADVPATLLPSSDVTSNRLIGGSWSATPIDDSDPGDDHLLAGRHGDVLVGDDGQISGDGEDAADRVVRVLLDVGGTDQLIGGAGDDRIFGGPGNDVLRGGGGDDHLEGGPGDDRLFGGAGDDILIGGSSRPGAPSGSNQLVGEAGDDVLAGDNARIERVGQGVGLHDSAYLVELYDPAGGTEPGDGDDVLIGGRLGGGTGSDDLLFGQGGDDLLFGDGARRVDAADQVVIERYGDITQNDVWGRFVPVEDGSGGGDLLSGGPGDDALFGGPGEDILLGGGGVMTAYHQSGPDLSDGVHVVLAVDPDASGVLTALEGVPSGNDVLSGGLGDDLLVGDNARVERIPGAGIDGADVVVERFDLAEAGVVEPDDVLGGDDVLIGGILGRGAAAAVTASDDVLYGLGGDDLLFGDNASLAAADPSTLDDPTAAGRYGDIGVNEVWGRFVPVDGGSGGDDRLEGGAGDDVLFGGPEDDVLVGGSDRHQPFADDSIAAASSVELRGMVTGNDVLVGGRGDDVMAGDNARMGGRPADDASEMATLFGIEIGPLATSPASDILLYDVAYAGEVAPHQDTAGDDVLIGGSIGELADEVDDPGNDVGFGQGGRDLLIGDDAQVLHDDDRRLAPLHAGAGDDHLEGGPGDDVIFGGPGDDLLIGGSSDRAVPDADTRGVVAGDDLLIGGPGQNVALGDNGRLRRADIALGLQPAGAWWPHPVSDPDQPWWWTRHGSVGPLAGAAIEPFDEPRLGETQPPGATAGDDLIVGGSLRSGLSEEGATPQASGDGLLGLPVDGHLPGSDLLHGQAGDDAMFGDDVLVRLDVLEGWDGASGAEAWQALRRGLVDTVDGPGTGWPLASIDHDTEGAEAAGGDDLLLGGPDDDVMFGGPGQDDVIGGSWDEGRLDGRDQMDAGPGHDVAIGDNARIHRPLVDSEELGSPDGVAVEDGRLLCQTYRHLEASNEEVDQTARLSAWQSVTGDHAAHDELGLVTDCSVGDPDPGDGIATRVVRDVVMLDETANPGGDGVSQTAGSDLILGGDGDDTIIGQFDDTTAFEAEDPDTDPFEPQPGSVWQGWSASRVVEWCQVDDALTALIDELDVADLAEGDTMADYLEHYFEGEDAIDGVAFAGDVLCGGDGEDTILGDQGLVIDIVEDGGRQELIAPRQPFVSTTIFEEGARTRQVELTDEPIHDHFERNVGGNDLILGGPGSDAIHGGAGDDIINGNDGDDHIFGGDGDDVIWGGRGDDHLYSGYGDTYLDVRPRPETSGFPGDPAAWFLIGIEADTYQGIDQIYGGWGSDVMQADEGDNGPVDGDRLMGWAGVYNLWYVCPGSYGSWISIRNIAPGLLDYLIDKAEGHGAVDPGSTGTSGFRELALVYNRDMRHNANPPHPETPGHFTCGVADPSA